MGSIALALSRKRTQWANQPTVWVPTTERQRFHRIIAGSTGSGKSVMMRSMIRESAIANDTFIFLGDSHGTLAKEVLKDLIELGMEDRILWDDLSYHDKVLGYGNAFLERSPATSLLQRRSDNQVWIDAFCDVLMRGREDKQMGPMLGKWTRYACGLWLSQIDPLPLSALPDALRIKSREFENLISKCEDDKLVDEIKSSPRTDRDIANDIEPARRLMEPLFNSSLFLARTSVPSNLNFTEIMQQKKILILSGGGHVSLDAVAQFIASTALAIPFTARRFYNAHDDTPLPAEIYIDEANSNGIPGKTEAKMLNQTRKWGVTYTHSLQDFSYDPDVVRVMHQTTKEQYYFLQPAADARATAADQLADGIYDPDAILEIEREDYFTTTGHSPQDTRTVSESTGPDGETRKGISKGMSWRPNVEKLTREKKVRKDGDMQARELRRKLSELKPGWHMYRKDTYVSPEPVYCEMLPKSCLTSENVSSALSRIRSNPLYQSPVQQKKQAKGGAAMLLAE